MSDEKTSHEDSGRREARQRRSSRRSRDELLQGVEPNKWSTKKVIVITAITTAVATIVIVVVLSIIVQLILHSPGAG